MWDGEEGHGSEEKGVVWRRRAARERGEECGIENKSEGERRRV